VGNLRREHGLFHAYGDEYPECSIQLMTSINQNDSESPSSKYNAPDTEASDAYTYSIGFGSQGLQQSDITQWSCKQCS
jgi:hypothetical protein